MSKAIDILSRERDFSIIREQSAMREIAKMVNTDTNPHYPIAKATINHENYYQSQLKRLIEVMKDEGA